LLNMVVLCLPVLYWRPIIARSEIFIIDVINVICYDVTLCLTMHEACMLAGMLCLGYQCFKVLRIYIHWYFLKEQSVEFSSYNMAFT